MTGGSRHLFFNSGRQAQRIDLARKPQKAPSAAIEYASFSRPTNSRYRAAPGRTESSARCRYSSPASQCATKLPHEHTSNMQKESTMFTRKAKARYCRPSQSLYTAIGRTPMRQHPMLVSTRRHVHDLERQRLERIREKYEERVSERAAYRASTDYEVESNALAGHFRFYENEDAIRELTKYVYRAGVSLSATRRERAMSEVRREEIGRAECLRDTRISVQNLEAIDQSGGFDSSETYIRPKLGPLPGDNHAHRTARRLLETDRNIRARVIRRRRVDRASVFLRRALLGMISILWMVTTILVMLEIPLFQEAPLSFALAPAVACSLPGFIWTRNRKKDRFTRSVVALQRHTFEARTHLERAIQRGSAHGKSGTDLLPDPEQLPFTVLLERNA